MGWVCSGSWHRRCALQVKPFIPDSMLASLTSVRDELPDDLRAVYPLEQDACKAEGRHRKFSCASTRTFATGEANHSPRSHRPSSTSSVESAAPEPGYEGEGGYGCADGVLRIPMLLPPHMPCGPLPWPHCALRYLFRLCIHGPIASHSP